MSETNAFASETIQFDADNKLYFDEIVKSAGN